MVANGSFIPELLHVVLAVAAEITKQPPLI
jgi:hypothetical protein